MKKKAIYLMGIAIVLLIGMIVYFKPLSLLDTFTLSENSEIGMILDAYVIRNGEPHLDGVEYNEITAEQKRAVLALFEKYTYRRTFGTLFSNGTITGGNKQLSIHMIDDNATYGSVFVTSSGKILVNAKNYRMENAEQFIKQIIKIMEQTD